MSEFVQRFLNEDWENLPQAPRVYVGAFGKHPAWNDHLDDIGLMTTSLAMARRSIYGSGIASQVESAAWDRAGVERTLATFDHTLLWRRGGECVVGRLWSSRDGVGRARYPMAVVAHCVGLKFDFVATEVMPALDTAEAGCVAATATTGVIAALAEAQRGLRMKSGPGGGDPVAVPDSAIGVDGWTAYFSLDRTDLERVFHHLRINFAIFAPGSGKWAEGEGAGKSRVLRLPRVPGSTEAEALNAWLSFVETQVDPAVPLLGLVHRKGNWVDVIVGEPAGTDFFALRAAPAAMPLLTDVPYQLDADTRSLLEPLFADITTKNRMPTRSSLNGETVLENREAADRWLARFRNTSRGGFFGRLLPGAPRHGLRFDLRPT